MEYLKKPFHHMVTKKLVETVFCLFFSSLSITRAHYGKQCLFHCTQGGLLATTIKPPCMLNYFVLLSKRVCVCAVVRIY